MNLTEDRTIGSIVAEDYRAAAVFTMHKIDFCCRGGRTLNEVCNNQNIDANKLLTEIERALERDTKTADDPNKWTLTRLADHIEEVHHTYVEQRIPVIQQYLEKLCKVHGDRHPELFDIAKEFSACAGAMAVHMKKEELLLFPFIKQLEKAKINGTTPSTPHFGTVNNPVNMMMSEHDVEGERFRRIAELTNGYTMPADGCATYNAAFNFLEEFEHDLHRHIHLENNILFPQAIKMEAELSHAAH